MIEIVLLSIGLAMDCVAVAAATGVAVPRVRARDALKMALAFGGMQGIMAAIGWAGGEALVRVIEAWDHWVAFGLLTLIGGKMILDGIRDEDGDEERAASFAWPRLLVLGIAVSIDSAAAGITLPVMEVAIPLALGTIAAASFLLTLVALGAAGRISERFAERLEIAGGIVLIGIGVKILVEHLLQ
ncbi:MAG: manganese efflux pump MntP family protein [Thermoanaerobaculia bacterium]